MARNRYAIARRSIWYVLRTLLIVAVVVVLALGAFVSALNISNMYILVTEGMQLRAECIMQDGSIVELTEYFSVDFVNNDAALYAGVYDQFTVNDFNYNIGIDSIKYFPWESTASFIVTERVASISGVQNKTEGDADLELPEWHAGRYEVSFSQVNSRWYMTGLTLIEADPIEEAKPTPDMSLISPTDAQ